MNQPRTTGTRVRFIFASISFHILANITFILNIQAKGPLKFNLFHRKFKPDALVHTAEDLAI